MHKITGLLETDPRVETLKRMGWVIQGIRFGERSNTITVTLKKKGDTVLVPLGRLEGVPSIQPQEPTPPPDEPVYA